jgi:enediyne biosynthesis protein E4
MNMNEPPSLLRNQQQSGNHWLRVRLEGSRSNRSAIGAVVTVESGGHKQTQAVLSQSSFLSQNDFRLHFGLGSSASVDRIEVRWPNGELQSFPAEGVDKTVHLVEAR